MALTMEQILRRTTPDRIDKARSTVRVSKLNLAISKATKLPLAAAQVYSLDRNADGSRKIHKYVTSILFRRTKKVKVSCSCHDFMYRFEWVLWKKGAADIVYSNGETPDITNPGYLGGCCKHLVALWDFLDDRNLVKPAEAYADKVKRSSESKSKALYDTKTKGSKKK